MSTKALHLACTMSCIVISGGKYNDLTSGITAFLMLRSIRSNQRLSQIIETGKTGSGPSPLSATGGRASS